jgi:hypothetical protein
MKKTIFFLIILSLTFNSFAQKKIRAKGDYLHPHTSFVFPTKLFNLERVNIYYFDTQKENIGVVYENVYPKTTVTIYIYPAGNGGETRLRSEFNKSLSDMRYLYGRSGFNVNYQPIRYEDDYICNGFTATVKDKQPYNSLTLYECGRWFFKIRITSDELKKAYLPDLEQKIIEHFDPSKLTALNPLKSKACVHIAPHCLEDTVLLDCMLAFTAEKVKWAIDSVSEKERASDFPSIYLGMHVAALKAFINFPKENYASYIASMETQKILDELQEMSDKGFLEEYVMDQFNMMAVTGNYVSEEEEWDNYLKWKNNREFLFKLTHILFSYIAYDEKE